MPNIWTHILFCEDVIDAVKKPYPFSQYETYMKLGAQGPDPFFYYNFWPWKKDDSAQKVGTALHTKKCGDFLMDLITQAKLQSHEVQAFVTGFITHHILDRNAHPYIHYRAGYEGSNHQRLEIAIDTLMMEKLHKLKSWNTPVYKEIDVGKSINSDVQQILEDTISKHYPELYSPSQAYIQKAYKDMMLALKILADPYGWKNILLKTFISPYSHRPIKNNIDYLNLKKSNWYHPATNERSNQSFMELYNIARVEAIEILTELQNYWQNDRNGHAKQRLQELIADISYDTGKPLELQLENKFSDPIV